MEGQELAGDPLRLGDVAVGEHDGEARLAGADGRRRFRPADAAWRHDAQERRVERLAFKRAYRSGLSGGMAAGKA
jgi:hypothetical protein